MLPLSSRDHVDLWKNSSKPQCSLALNGFHALESNLHDSHQYPRVLFSWRVCAGASSPQASAEKRFGGAEATQWPGLNAATGSSKLERETRRPGPPQQAEGSLRSSKSPSETQGPSNVQEKPRSSGSASHRSLVSYAEVVARRVEASHIPSPEKQLLSFLEHQREEREEATK